MNGAADCIFCAIASGQAAARMVMETDEVMAFLDLFPLTPGHTLVIPKKHADNLAQLPGDLGGKMFQAGQRLAAAMRRADMEVEAVNFFLADGEVAGQTVFHSHLHVIPRRSGDGFGVRHGLEYGKQLAEEAATQYQHAIMQGLKRLDDGVGAD